MMWMSWFVLGGFLLLWYPTGRIPSARWRVVQWVGVVAELEAVSYLLARDVCVAGQSEGSCAVFQRNPIGIDFVPNPEFSSSGDLGFLVVLGFILASVVALGVRYRRARGVERLQLKGLVFACLLLVAVVVVQETVPGLPVWLDNTVFGLGVLALPTAIGVSILRYRLYGIERVISRTFGYGIVAAVVVVVYLVLATLVPTELIGQRSPAFVAGATLAAATIFNPVRRRVLRSVDRRFYRSRYDAELEIAAFAGHLTERLDVDSLAADWLEVVARTMHPQSASVWVQERGVAARTR